MTAAMLSSALWIKMKRLRNRAVFSSPWISLPSCLLRPPLIRKLILFPSIFFLYSSGLRLFTPHGVPTSLPSILPIVRLEDGPRATVALTSLGLEADESYHLGSLSPSQYRYSLHDFVNVAFPSHLGSQLADSLKLYLNFNSTAPRPERPKIIWQTNHVRRLHDQVMSWQHLNPDHEYRFLDDRNADSWLRRTFSGTLIEWTWDYLPHAVARADFLRYLLLLVEGGVYSDIDTTCLKPISRWGFDSQVRGQVIEGSPSAIVGIEADVGSRADWHKWWSRPVQLAQWTMAFSPGHPVLIDVVRRIYARSRRYATLFGRPNDMRSTINMITEWTGPGVFTDAMLRFSLLESDIKWPDLRSLSQPLRTGSVTFLPVTGFSPAVGNFGAGEKTDPQAMVYHAFEGSWKLKDH